MELSNKASTASCRILFSFLKITAGALISCNFFNLLFLFITLRYKSLTSDVACLPPSRATIGLSAGGRMGILFKNIHSGLVLDFINDLIKLNLFIIFSLSNAPTFSTCSSSFFCKSFKFNSLNTSYMTSAPVPASKSAPYFNENLLYSVSSSIFPFCIFSISLLVLMYISFKLSFDFWSLRVFVFDLYSESKSLKICILSSLFAEVII